VKPTFREIPQFPRAGYEVNVPWMDLETHLNRPRPPAIILEPDYQRGHVWSADQQTAFVEYGLMGGESSMIITSNCPGWMINFKGPYEVVDGLQRITAVRRFMRGEIKAFGHTIKEYADEMSWSEPSFRWRVLSLRTRQEVLKLYLLLNDGGVVHSPQEIERVRELLASENRPTIVSWYSSEGSTTRSTAKFYSTQEANEELRRLAKIPWSCAVLGDGETKTGSTRRRAR